MHICEYNKVGIRQRSGWTTGHDMCCCCDKCEKIESDYINDPRRRAESNIPIPKRVGMGSYQDKWGVIRYGS